MAGAIKKEHQAKILSETANPRTCLEQLRGVSEGFPNKSVEGKVLVTSGEECNVGGGKGSMWMLCQVSSTQAYPCHGHPLRAMLIYGNNG